MVPGPRREARKGEPRRRGRGRLLAVALLGGSVLAVPTMAVGASPAPTSKAALRWRQGDALPGRMLDCAGGKVLWSSPIFADDLTVEVRALESIVFESGSDRISETLRVRTIFGDVFGADLVGSDQESFLLSNRHFGPFRVSRGAVGSLQPSAQPSLIFDGSRLDDWYPAGEAPISDLSYRVYREDRGWNGNEFPDLWRLEPIDQGHLPAGSLDPGLAGVEGRYGVAFDGRIDIREADVYRIDLWADDWARLFLDGRYVAGFRDLRSGSAAEQDSQLIHLERGFHFLRVEYVNLGGDSGLVANLTGPDARSRPLAGPNPGSGWKPGPGGRPQTDRTGSALVRGIELPERFEIKIELKSSSSPRFVLALENNPQTAESTETFRLETWGDELVLVQGGAFRSVMTLPGDRHDIGLRLGVDSEVGEAGVFGEDGTLLANLRGVELAGESGIYLRNGGRDLTVWHLSVHRWPAVQAVHPDEDATAPNDRTNRQSVPSDVGVLTGLDSVELSYRDGSILRGQIVGFAPDQIFLRTAFSETSVASALGGVVILRFDREGSTARPSSAETDRLFFAPGHLRGTLVFGVAGSPLGWKLEGADTPLRLRPTAGLRVERNPGRVAIGASYDCERYPHVAYLKTGEVIPCRVTSYDQATLGLQSPFLTGREMAAALVKGIQFGPVLQRILSGDDRSGKGRQGRTDPVLSGVPVDEVRLQRALTVPRFSRARPPSHILVAKTGDITRGTLLGIKDSTLLFESKLRRLSVALDRLACVVDVRPAEPPAGEMPDAGAATIESRAADDSFPDACVCARLADGPVLIFEARELVNGRLSGPSPAHGYVAVPVDNIQDLTFGRRAAVDLESRFAEWTLRPAREPDFIE